jgi:DNA-binding response OmpR family regulator
MPFRNLPILLVEGDDELRYSFLEHLQRHGFFGIGASSAEDAVRILADRRVRMAIIDFDLPGGRGHLLADQLHVTNPQIPIIGHSSETDLDAQLSAYSYGIDELWMKPQPLSLAIAKCRAMLRRTLAEALTDSPLQLGDVTVDLRRQIVMRDHEPVALNEKELGIIRTLAMEEGAPLGVRHTPGRADGGQLHRLTAAQDRARPIRTAVSHHRGWDRLPTEILVANIASKRHHEHVK